MTGESTSTATGLAYELRGTGVPVVFLHGLTFDRTTWTPVIERLGDGVLAVPVDLPGHGESEGPPCSLDELAGRVRELVRELGIGDPVVVGHSISGALAFVYASTYPALGAVTVDQGVDIRGFAATVRRLEPVLRSAAFGDAFAPFQASMGIDRIPEPHRSLVLASQRVDREVVLGYWEEPLRTDPDVLQARIDGALSELDVPCLAIFGGEVPDEERTRLARVPDLELEAWPDGHFVHLVDVDRFALRLRRFVDRCAAGR
jgi:pimeloyl-ACP methyl ester carboxylesterase